MLNISNLQSRHYMVLPAPKFFNTPASLNFTVSLSGVAVLEDFIGFSDEWRMEVLNINAIDMRMDRVLTRALSSLPPLPPEGVYKFVPIQWTVYSSAASFYNLGNSRYSGIEVDDWKIVTGTSTTFPLVTTVNTFEGMEMDISVRGKGVELKKVGYELNLYGYFAQIRIPDID